MKYVKRRIKMASYEKMKIYLEYQDEKSHKFWEITININDYTHTVRYGKVGAKGRTTTKAFDSEEKAIKEAQRLIRMKVRKGYDGDYKAILSYEETPKGVVRPKNAPLDISWKNVYQDYGYWQAQVAETETDHTLHLWNKYGELYQEIILDNVLVNNLYGIVKETYLPPQGMPDNAEYKYYDEWEVPIEGSDEVLSYHFQNGKWEIKPQEAEIADVVEKPEKSKPKKPKKPKKGQKYFLQAKKEKIRPANVPPEAQDNYDYWKLGEYGEWFEEGCWKYWTMDGYLFMEALFEEGKIVKKTYFPPEGVPQDAIWLNSTQKIRGIYFCDCWMVENKAFLEKNGTIDMDCYTQSGEQFRTLKLDKDYKKIAEFYTPLKSIPKGVVWNVEYEEWQLGKYNEKDKKIGEWKSWDEFGNLKFEAEFNDKGIPISKVVYSSYLFEEEPNKYYFYDNDGEQSRCEYYRKVADCNHIYPFYCSPLGKKAYKVVEKNGRLSYYDECDKPLKRKKRKTTWKQYLQPQTNETAIEAYNRYITLLETLKNEYAEDEEEREEIDGYKPIIKKQHSFDEVKEIEQEMGFIFPPSYVEFVTKVGLIETVNDENGMFSFDDAYSTMPFKEKLKYEWDYDMEAVLSKKEQTLMNNVLPFSNGDESRQAVWYYCFNYNTLNQTTGEVDVYALDQDDIYRLHHELSTTPTQVRGFDVHIQHIVQEMIEYFLDNFEIEA